MINPEYVPERGDVVWILLRRPVGAERVGRQQAVVLSPSTYNGAARLAIVCPIAPQGDLAYAIPLPAETGLRGLVLADQPCSLDWETRAIEYVCRLPPQTVRLVQQRMASLLMG